MQLLTIHFAGGNKFSLNTLKKYLPASIPVQALEFPGRTEREELVTDIHVIVEQLFAEVVGYIEKPYALFGYSMGTTVAYLLTKEIISRQLNPPFHLFMGGRMGPSFPFVKNRLYQLPKDQFWQAIEKMNGTPAEVLYNNLAKEYFEPLLRADFEAIERYTYQRSEPLSIPITVFYGSEEGMDERILEVSWQRETVGPVIIHRMPGDHFFINRNWEEIAAIVKDVSTYF